MILRMFWDGEEEPSVEVPIGDFFCNGWGEPVNVNSQPIAELYIFMNFKQVYKRFIKNLLILH